MIEFKKLERLKLGHSEYEGMYIDIIKEDDTIEIWIGHKAYGIKEFVFGTVQEINIYKIIVENQYKWFDNYLENRKKEDQK